MEGTKKFDSVQPMLSAIEPPYLRGLVTNSKTRWFKKQCGSKQLLPTSFLLKMLPILPQIGYRTPQHPQRVGKLKAYNDVIKL